MVPCCRLLPLCSYGMFSNDGKQLIRLHDETHYCIQNFCPVGHKSYCSATWYADLLVQQINLIQHDNLQIYQNKTHGQIYSFQLVGSWKVMIHCTLYSYSHCICTNNMEQSKEIGNPKSINAHGM